MEFRKSFEPSRLTPSQTGTLGIIRRNTYGGKDNNYKPDTISVEASAPKSFLQRTLGIDFDFFLLMFVCQVIIMHWVGDMASTAEPFVFMGYHVPAPTMNVYTAITTLPLTLKPILGLLSDTVPIMGYAKTPYCLIISVAGIAGMIACGCSPGQPVEVGLKAFFNMGSADPPAFKVGYVVLCMFLVNMMTCMADVFTQGMLSEKVNQQFASAQTDQNGKKKGATDLIAVFVCLGLIGGVGAHFVCGMVVSHWGAPRVYTIAACGAIALPLWVMFRGFGDRKMSAEKIAEIRRFFSGQKEVIGLTLLLCIGVLIMIFVPLAAGNDAKLNFIFALVVSLVIITAFTLVLCPMIARINFVFFVSSAMYINISGAAVYFMTDNKYQFPGGPNFTKLFTTFTMPTVCTISSLVGVAVFKRVSVGWTLQRWEALVAFLWGPTLILDVAWVLRWNIAWGISDEFFSLIVMAVKFFWVAMRLMPYSFAIPRMCPTGLESTMCQLLFGCSNMGRTVSEDIGALVLQWFEVTPSGAFFEQASFDRYWEVVVLQCALAFIASVILIPILPNCALDEQLIRPDRHDAATHGSLWKMWRARRSPDNSS